MLLRKEKQCYVMKVMRKLDNLELLWLSVFPVK